MNKHLAIQKAKILKALIELSKASKILTTFIPAFKKAILKKDGTAYLHGSFNIGGTVSGRMSSCLPENVLIYSKEGYKPLKDISIGDLVLTHKGNFKTVLNKVDNGIQDIYEIELDNGNTLRCTSNHRLLTEHGFKSLEDIYYETSRQNISTTSIRSFLGWIFKRCRRNCKRDWI